MGIVRPDIIVHSREDETIYPQNYLVIEAKKKANTDHDEYKVFSFIIDKRFLYKFGLTISYGSDKENIIGKLWYFNGDNVVPEPIKIPKA